MKNDKGDLLVPFFYLNKMQIKREVFFFKYCILTLLLSADQNNFTRSLLIRQQFSDFIITDQTYKMYKHSMILSQNSVH